MSVLYNRFILHFILLIVPEGIEIQYFRLPTLFAFELLIVPEGIEIWQFFKIARVVNNAFNRTRRN